MEMLQLRYFFESAKNGSFSKTAKKYMVPSTSVSAAIKRLEQELGCKLFDRTCNKIVLNEKGRRLQKSLYVVFDELEEISHELSMEDDDKREIKVLVRAMRSKITDAIIEYKNRRPDAIFKTVFDFSEKDYEDYDIIVEQKSSDLDDAYDSFELYNTQLRLRAVQNSGLCGKKLTLSQLKNEPFVSMGEQSDIQKVFVNRCLKEGFMPNIVVQSNDILCFERCVKAGIGIGITRSPDPYPPENTAFLNVTDLTESYTISLYYKKQAYYGNIKSFIDFLKNRAD